MGRAEWPFGQRDDIVALLRAPLVTHGATVVFLTGVAGVGKSRIARECGMWHRRRGRRVTWVGANASLGTIPWGAFAELDVPQGPPIAILRDLVERIGRGPNEALLPLLIVDDAHHLDNRSAAVVVEVAHQRKASLVLTVRQGMRLPDAVRMLIEADTSAVIAVEELGRQGLAEVVSSVLEGRLRPSSVDQMHELTRGNFLYLRELVRGELDADRLQRHGDEWAWHRDTSLPQGLANVVASRLGSLEPALAELVDLLAVASPLMCTVYERLVGREVVERAELAGLVRTTHAHAGTGLEAGHPLFAEIARQRMGVRRRTRLSGALATAWEEVSVAEGRTATVQDALRVATLRAHSDLITPIDQLTDAATLALSVTDLELAERLSRRALATSEHPAALFSLGLALTWQAQGEEADRVLQRYAELVPGGDRDVVLARAGTLFWPLRRPAEAIAFVDAAIHALAQTPEIAGLRAMRALFTVLTGDIEHSLGFAHVDGEAPDAFGAVLESWARTAAFAFQGRSGAALEAAQAGYAQQSEVPTTLRFGIAEMHLAGVRIDGRVEHADAIAKRVDAAATWGGGVGTTLERRLLARAALIGSRLQDAVDLLEDLRTELLPLAANGWLFCAHLDLAQALALQGESTRARAALNAVRADMHPAFAFAHSEVEIAEALVLAAEGRIRDATKVARRAAERAREAGAFGYEALALAVSAQLGDASVAARLGELSAHVEGPRVIVACAHANALGEADGVALAAVSVRYEQMGDLVAAADAAAHASAQLHRSARTSDALRESRRAVMLAKRAQGARTYALGRLDQPPSLSPREYEISRLAAEGMTNRAIADMLGISVRTVEGHVLRAIAKTGVGSRGGGARGGGQHPPTS